MPSAAAAAELATAYLAIVPSMKGARESITSQVTPAAEAAGAEGGASLGGMLLGGIKRFAAPIAVLAAGFGIHKVIEDSTEAFEHLGDTTLKLQGITGGSVSQVTSLTGAMSFFGMNTDTSSQTLGIFSKNLGNATKDGATSSAMVQKLGFDFRDAHGQVLPMSDLMPKLADKFKSMPDGAQKTALAMQLFGRSGAQMLPFLNQGAAGLEELEGKAKSSGLVLDDVSMRIFMQGKLSAAAWTGSIQGAKVALGQDLAPVLEAFHNTGRNLVIPLLNDFASMMNAGRDKALAFADGVEKFGERGADAVKGLLTLVKGGGFSEELRKGFGVEEDSPVVAGLLGLRTKVAGVLTGISADFTNAKAGFKMPGLDTSTMSAGLAEAVHFGEGVRKLFDDVKSTVGSSIGPIWATLKSAAQPIIQVFQTMLPTLAPLIPQILGLASAFSPLSLIIRAILPVLPQLLNAFGQLAGSVAGALMSTLTTLVPVITSLSGTLVHLLSGVIIQLMPTVITVVGMLGKIFGQLGPIVGQVLAAIMPLVTMILGVAIQAFTLLLPPIIALVNMALPLLVRILGVVISAILPVVQILAAVLIPIVQALLPVITTVFTVIASVITAAMGIVQGIIEVVLGIITGNWSMVWTGIQDFIGGIWNTIVAVVGGVLSILSSEIGAALGFISGIWNTVWGGISGFFAGIWGGLIGAAQDGMGQILGFFTGLGGQIVGALSGAGSWLIGIGKDMINGLLSGIGSMVGAIGQAILSIIPGPIVGVFKAALGIASPSKVFHGFGVNTMEGYVNGVVSQQDAVRAAVTGTAALATGAFNAKANVPGMHTAGLAGGARPAAQVVQHIHTQDPETAAELGVRKLLRAGIA